MLLLAQEARLYTQNKTLVPVTSEYLHLRWKWQSLRDMNI
jgi:hypothetical protein